jgi:hypothetical protein
MRGFQGTMDQSSSCCNVEQTQQRDHVHHRCKWPCSIMSVCATLLASVKTRGKGAASPCRALSPCPVGTPSTMVARVLQLSGRHCLHVARARCGLGEESVDNACSVPCEPIGFSTHKHHSRGQSVDLSAGDCANQAQVLHAGAHSVRIPTVTSFWVTCHSKRAREVCLSYSRHFDSLAYRRTTNCCC